MAAGPLTGTITAPGDKSLSHRALIFGTLASGETFIDGLLESDDVLRTAAALGAMGAAIERDATGQWRVRGVGVSGLRAPDDVIDLGNSGTAARLLAGVIGGQAITAILTGDASLRRRPMARVATPLRQMGVRLTGRAGDRLPMMIAGTDLLLPVTYNLPVASAQVKSAVLLAGLAAPGTTTVIEGQPTRDHTERMAALFGAEIATTKDGAGCRVAITGQPELTAQHLDLPGDPSSAAFMLVAAAMIPGSEVTVRRIGFNPARIGLFETLSEMGADLTITHTGESAGEPVADVTIRGGPLRGVDVPAARAPRMIDEYPILAVAAAAAEGPTTMHGLAELKVKESDRLNAIAAGLTACGVTCAIADDSLTVQGCGGAPPGGGRVTTHHDHRIAMAFLILGMATKSRVAVDHVDMIATSFPDFRAACAGLGARLEDAPAPP